MKQSSPTKAGRLADLFTKGFGAYLLPQFVLHRETFQQDLIDFKASLGLEFDNFAVRSSSSDEDQDFSNAGRYLSLLNVNLANIEGAITRVLESYSPEEKFGEVLIQPMLKEVSMSGVLFTYDPSTGSPYQVINLNSSSVTDSITSGAENGRLIIIGKKTAVSEGSLLGDFQKDLLEIIDSISHSFDSQPLDFEFAISADRSITILQVRPLQVKRESLEGFSFNKELDVCHEMVNKVSVKHPTLFGEATFLSVMSDWNPAELIGVRPTQLAISLFKELISDNIWAYERSNFGYKNMRSFPLMIELAGQPFIDLRVSFNSLMPEGLSTKTSQELASHYLQEFRASPAKHDKVEFELYFSSYTAKTRKRVEATALSSESQINLIHELLNLTSGIVRSNPYGIRQSMAKTSLLENKLNEILNTALPTVTKIYWLVENCKRYGTLPFSGIARCAFIATEILKSFVEVGSITQLDLDAFLMNIESIPSKLGKDLRCLEKEQFLAKYGHLRPGTFDIRNLTYAENYDLYFKELGKNQKNQSEPKNIGDSTQLILESIIRNESSYLEELGVTAIEFIDFCKTSIKGREDTKFLFSKHISAILTLIAELGKDFGINRSELSHLDIKQVLKLHSESEDPISALNESIAKGRRANLITQAIWLPPVITSAHDVYEFEVPESIPNFITQNSVTGRIVNVDQSYLDLEGKIVLIESADPGFDWIFSHQIAGLVTCYGGANSHMAVRAYELGVPSAIGVGNQIFAGLTTANSAFLDCSNKRIEILE